MILQSLCNYYQRLEEELPPFGFEEKAIPYIVVVDREGKFIDLQSNSDEVAGKTVARVMRIPKASGRSGAKSYETAYCLWDHYGYIAAQPKIDKPGAEPSPKDIDMAQKQHASFKRLLAQLIRALPDDQGVNAVNLFLNSTSEVEKLKAADEWQNCLKTKGCNLSFKLAGETQLVCQSAAVINWVKQQPLAAENCKQGICLVTGKTTKVVRLHDMISGVAQKPAPLAAINDSAYCSRGKNKGFNFPVSAQAAFQYATSLNHLLRRSSPSKFRIGDTSYICWASQDNQLESSIPLFLNDVNDNPELGAERIKNLLASLYNGAYQGRGGSDQFFVLGLAPNSARIVIRFWQVGTVAEFSTNLARWFSDLKIEGVEYYGYPSIGKILRTTALQYKDDNIPPNLPSDLVRSILSASPLPVTLAQAAIRRIKADKGNVTYLRASLLKAYLNRKILRNSHNTQGEITVALNKKEKRIGYCLGRLFAVLEKLQLDAQGKINATIRDRYYSSASCTPKAVFAILMRLSTSHLRKLKNESWRVAAEKRIGEIMDLIDVKEFPSRLMLEEQSIFAIGYYHQKQDFYLNKKEPRGKELTNKQLTNKQQGESI